MLSYTKSDLSGVPEEEAVFFLMACQLHNDLAVLLRLLLQNRIENDAPEPVRAATGVTQLLLIRMIAGRTHEGWTLVRAKFQKIFQEYGDEIGPSARAEFARLKTYFGNGSLVSNVRKTLAFHSDFENIAKAYSELDPKAELTDFRHPQRGNTIYYGADIILTRALVDLTGMRDRRDGLLLVLDEIRIAAGGFLDVVQAFVSAFCGRHLAERLKEMDPKGIVVGGQPNVYAMRATPFIFAPTTPVPNRRRSLLGGSASPIPFGY